jgi:glycosyltransferase involved in cell wall biosynthesis
LGNEKEPSSTSRGLRIAIDARMIESDGMHGIARYVFHLLQALREDAGAHEIFVWVKDGSPLREVSWPSHMTLVSVSASWLGLRQQWQLPRLLRKYQIDIYHAPSFVAPLFCPCPLVMTIHDLNHVVLWDLYTPFHRLYYRFFVRRCMEKAVSIITVSQFSKQEMIRVMGIPKEKIQVIYNGVDPSYRPIEDLEIRQLVREKYGLPEKFLFCVSNTKPYKNSRKLIEAYAQSSLDIPLVLALGKAPDLVKYAASCDKKGSIRFLGFIEEAHLPVLYGMAELFVYPSTYEGFGFPPLEAMACGTPAVVSCLTSLPEVVGESGCFLHPFDIEQMALDIVDALHHVEIEREELQRTDAARREKFSWIQMAKKTVAIYEKSARNIE